MSTFDLLGKGMGRLSFLMTKQFDSSGVLLILCILAALSLETALQ